MRRAWVQISAAGAAVLGGAWLIGLWAVGVVLVLAGVAAVADVVFRTTDRWEPRQGGTHKEVLERWNRAP